MSEIRTNLQISGEALEYRGNISISVATLDTNLVDTQSSFRTTLNVSTKASESDSTSIQTTLEFNNTSLNFNLVDMTKLNQSVLYFSKFLNLNFEEEYLWELLSQNSNYQINYTHISDVLSSYAKTSDIVPKLTDINTNINTLSASLLAHANNINIHLTEEEKVFINKLMKEGINTGGSEGDSFWVEDENGDLLPTMKNDGTARGVKAKRLYIPNSDGSEIIYQLYVGELGEGADIPSEGGGGTADFSQIKVYDTNDVLLGNGSSSGKITITPYPVVPTKVSAFENDEGYLKEEDISGLATRVGDAETNITNLGTRADELQEDIEEVQNDVSAILDDYLSKANGGTIKGAVTIQAALKMNTLYLPNSNNTPSDYTLSIGTLGAGADTPEGGGSGIAQVTINVNGSPYSTNANGVVTLPNYPTSLPASDVSSWAKKSSLAASDVPNLDWSKITSGKPTTLAGYGITDALSTSGGTISGGIGALHIYRNDEVGSFIGFSGIEGNLGYLGFRDKGRPGFFDPNWNVFDIIHSGNIGDYAALSYGEIGANSVKGNASGYTYATNGGKVSGGFISAGLSSYGFQLNGDDETDALYYRGYTPNGYNTWKTIAFTDSTIAAANSVYSPSGKEMVVVNDGSAVEVFGSVAYDTYVDGKTLAFRYGNSYATAMTINSSGNVTIGGSDLASGDWSNRKLYVSGYMANETYTNNMILFQPPSSGSGGSGIVFWHKTDATYNRGTIDASTLCLNAMGGNVLIGSTTDSGYKLDVAGNIRASTEIRNDTSMSTWAAYQLRFNGITCGLYADDWISGGDASRLWLYNAHNLAIYGSTIELHSNTWIAGNFSASGNISASGYQLPTSAPSNPVSGGYYLYVGTLGAGATIS